MAESTKRSVGRLDFAHTTHQDSWDTITVIQTLENLVGELSGIRDEIRSLRQEWVLAEYARLTGDLSKRTK